MVNFVSVLIAEGPNDVCIPCRIYNLPIDEAKIKCEELLGVNARYLDYGNNEFYSFQNEEWQRQVPFEDWDEESQEYILERWERPVDLTFMTVFARKLFTNYYDGCGGVYSFRLEEVKCDSVFIGWNLD
jgi:hypothetical protein